MQVSPAVRSWLCLQVLLVALLALPASGVILLSGDNSANQTMLDPARANIFNSVAQVVDGLGQGGYGSAVHLRGKYMLTAAHVTLASHVTFDGGTTLYERDTAFNPVYIGTADLKLFKLVKDPGLPEVKLFNAADGDIPYSDPLVYTTATIVGVGVGRSPADDGADTTWVWGDGSTMAKRWGENRIEGTYSVTDGYNYQALVTTLETTSGNNEAAVTYYDSGCGLFVEHAGEWKLAGIAVAVSNISGPSTSTFDNASSDINYFVRIKTYAAAIEAAIPNPSTYAGWKLDHSLYNTEANDDADTDGDGIPQLLEYALGGDPRLADRQKLPIKQLTTDGGNDYLELVVTRPIGIQGLNYIPQTTTDLSSWPLDSNGIVNDAPAAANNGNGTETLVYRRSLAVSAAQRAFMRLKIQTN